MLKYHMKNWKCVYALLLLTLLSDAKFSRIQRGIIMLLPDNIHPELSIYYNSSFVLRELKKENNQKILYLYNSLKMMTGMSFPVFLLCLDWLYLIEAAEIDERGCVSLCI